jgi:hypothetical protein
MKIRNLFFLLFAVVFLAPVLAADAPDCSTAPSLRRGGLEVWPLHQRVDLAVPGDARTGLMNTFGEFQFYDSGAFAHTGIDIRGIWTPNAAMGDIVLVVADGDLWAVPNFDEDGCEHASNCRVYIKSTNRRHIYYYAHLNVRKGGDEDALDSELRDQLAKASVTLPKDDLPVGSNPVSAGQHLAGLGLFQAGFTHLHFSIFDACGNYDGLNPLIFLAAPTVGGEVYVDKTAPAIGPVRLVREDGMTEVNPGSCAPVLNGKVDVIVEAKDAYHDLTPDFKATHSNGISSAQYRIRRAPSGPLHDGRWYFFDRAPFRCRGSQRGIACADPDAVNGDLLDQNDFIDSLAMIAQVGSGAPSLAVSFADVLFNNVSGPFKSSSSYDTTEKYFHTLTHSWGFSNQPGTWDTAQFPDGRYQVSVEVADASGNKAASHRFVVLSNNVGPIQTGDLVIRDHPEDVGAVPSTWGGKTVGISPDIKVTKMGEPDPVDPGAAVWKAVQQPAPKVGQQHKVWVRVKNTGCQKLNNVRVRAAWANPSLTQKTQIGQETALGVSLAPGAAVVLGPFAWTPVPQQAGDGSLLSIIRADADPATVAGFGAVVSGTIGNDSNVGQLKLKVQ